MNLKQTLKARWVLPIIGPPIENGCVEIYGDKIVHVGKCTGMESVDRDLGDVALLPALVNCHTHLEFSDLAGQLGEAGNSLPDWIRQVVRARLDFEPAAKLKAIESGIRQSHEFGVGLVGEISTWPLDDESVGQRLVESTRSTPVTQVCFWERLGTGPTDVQEKTRSLEVLDRLNSEWEPGLLGISPHAPYSTHADLVRACVACCRQQQRPLAIHLAESSDELEFIASRAGSFCQLLQDFGIEVRHDGYRSVPEIIRAVLQAPRALLVHGNYLDADDLDLIAAGGPSHSIVFCPRTHAYFGHAPYPLEKMLERGIRVVLGTDSLASNPDLDILAEARHVKRDFPSIPAEQLLQMITLEAATALGQVSNFGSLEPGKQARLAVAELAGDAQHLPHSFLDDPSSNTNCRPFVMIEA